MTRRRDEERLQAALEEHLRQAGLRYMHHYDSRRSVAGWPDIFAVRGTRAVTIEVKTASGRVSKAQQEWIDALNLAGVQAMIVRLPCDWGLVGEVLR